MRKLQTALYGRCTGVQKNGSQCIIPVMTMVSPVASYTPEDLLELDGLFELVDGQLVEKPMSFLAGETASIITFLLRSYLQANPGGRLSSEATFRCFPQDPDLIRRPDIAFIAAARAKSVPDEGHVTIPPDLAIEVISPGDKINDFEDKLADYRSAGIKLVWEVNPTFRYVRIHHPDRSTVLLEENDTLTGESVLPGFSVKVGHLMPAV